MARNIDNSPENAINRIVEGTQVEGDIKSESNIRIDGHFTGNINTKGRLVVGKSGKIKGSVQCEHAEIEGVLEGRISVQELLSLKSSSKLEGEIYTEKLSIESGASFTGECFMGSKVKNMNFGEGEESLAAAEEKSA